ncbi:hypothetical protein AWZ03_009520 [Drosophila navojoa]|uniref:Uncharacterized protein n=1 Tax=Drosophila navojoa TaxID=7232 RepID=A0A484B851_DRONA|nr:uncharacterized protein LOC108657505 [Drosophila navojoa]XP_030242652.1 uncharacterized protein LOC108657505 [Drosophila navojoa]TDG44031.1 hypothetical protein AWZ03_009520 [Drosophila navojoa]
MQFTTSCMMALLLLLLAITQLTTSAPAEAVLELQDGSEPADLNPINAEEVLGAGELERNKRKLPDATFEAKNAVLGFVFGKIDNFLDTKTRVIEQLDRSNIEKNKQWDIKSPVPIKDFQTLITAVVSPKIRSIGNIANDLTTGVLTTITAFSGSSSGNGNPNAGLGNVVSKFLSFSGPILQGSSGGANGIAGVTTPAPDSDEAGY